MPQRIEAVLRAEVCNSILLMFCTLRVSEREMPDRQLSSGTEKALSCSQKAHNETGRGTWPASLQGPAYQLQSHGGVFGLSYY